LQSTESSNAAAIPKPTYELVAVASSLAPPTR
jgi:hypothetical protein